MASFSTARFAACVLGVCFVAHNAAAGDVAADKSAEPRGVEPAAEPASAPACCLLSGRVAHLIAAEPAAIRAVESEGRLVISIGDEPFAEYRTDVPHQPAIWPIYNSAGVAMTRSYPLGPQLPGERADHPHHESVWFSHGDVNGHDFWHLSNEPLAAQGPRIVHRGFVSIEGGVAGDSPAGLVANNEWIAAGEGLLADERRVQFGADASGAVRWIDFKVTLKAGDEPIVFGDTKEGTFGVRVPGAMKTDAGRGGKILAADGTQDSAAWGGVSGWIKYAGPLVASVVANDAGETEPPTGAIVVMNHPSSAGGACRWHVRGYGLFAANPFGESDFGGERPRPGRLEANDQMTLRYRVAFFAGDPESDLIETLYNEFADSP